MFSVYILYSKTTKKFYVSTTDDVVRRLNEHNTAKRKHAFTVSGIPWEIFLTIDNLHSAEAYALEKHIKSMKSSVYIKNLKKYPEMIVRIKAKFAGSSR
jgi:putative endonuclease